ncbi:MAG: TonB-dependent receptor [Lentisphaerae bacterium]|jgi:hemoglobin/transferrin/lactoferrin receptor protein|nr:TonB-dependent receptor [Lentisphaerota bacterium]MBT4819428.1 TonB-dependent receptor [Lentisphaerota bacterium]MBT5605191.1 TonB-dependent receptor [Lentisphaerota bacterium]MBT7054357.1 TonB-dependent receptor [Lentisphaerota bacterium]MBT7844859.1 TonB-dependent receptor [Lentisphaerota bacterium]
MPRPRLASLTAALLLAVPLHETRGEDTASRVLVLDPVLITARGRGSRLSATPGGLGLVRPEQITVEQPLSLTNITSRLPGVTKASDSAWGSAINIRGLSRNRVLFLVDGARVNTATDINAQFGTVNASDVQRIEVLKGPVSSLYGSGSIGGVVNVLTKSGSFQDEPGWHGELNNSLQTNPSGPNTYGNVTYGTDRWWVFASGSWRDHDSYEDADGNDVHNSQFTDHHGTLKLALKWDEEQMTEFQYQRLEARDVGVPGKGLSLPTGPDVAYPRTTRELVSLTHTIHPGSGALEESRVQLYRQEVGRRVEIDRFPGGPVNLIAPEADHVTLGARWQNTIVLAPHTVVGGLDVWNWSYKGERKKFLASGATIEDSPLADSEQLSAGLFAEDDWALTEALVLNLGARVDLMSSTSEEILRTISPPGPVMRGGQSEDDISWNAHVGLTWMAGERWSTTFLVASSYRSPDLLDRYKYLNLGGGGELFGNPDLDPEQSFFVEYGLHYTGPRVRVSGSLFANVIDDLIVDPSPGVGVRGMENVEEAEITGLELDAEWLMSPDLRAYGNVAYAEGVNKTRDEALSFVPPLNGLLGLRYGGNSGPWAQIETEWAANQSDVASAETRTDGWAAVNANVGYGFEAGHAHHDIVLSADNLFDTDYRNHLSTSRGFELREPGRNVQVTWRVLF